ncbi:MAG: malonyl CoA-acyl carrier protein transacylase, partial [Ramlibacter sp.]|nr:malonyl CoA-acyl carrier protein transacylase [Ramlibacter sp.]
HSVDLDRMLAQKVDLCGRLFQRIYERMASGRLWPLPVTTYGADNVAEAYQAMAAAAHTGKLVIDTTTTGIAVQPTANIAFRADRSYLISGGLGGFGLQLAAWLAQRGAGRLVLLGRRGGKTPGADAAAARLRALGAEVQIEACDLSASEDVRRVLSRIPAHRPLAGVFHAAAVLDDALVKNMNAERYYRTFAPKAVGAWNLHRHTLGAPVDYFMCFSSIASLIGNQGSANYCAANAFTDTLAHYRHSLGLPALTVNWGVIADVGMAADEDFYRQNLERNGLQTIHSSHGLEMLEVLLLSGRVQTAVCPMDMETWLRFNPAGREGRLRELLNAAGEAAQAKSRQSAEEANLRAKLDALSEDERELFGRNTIRDVVAGVLRTDSERISTTRSLTALGVDSLMDIEIKNRLDALGLALSVAQLLNRNSVVSLSAKLLESLNYCNTADASRDESPGVENQPAASWLVRFEPRENAKIRLFCFPYAGGGISVYKSWVVLLPDWVELVAVSLPGRGVRADEKSAENIAYFAEAIVPEMLALLDRPFALFGHCMGAIVMYETAQRLQDAHKKVPAHIFASGCMAPHLYNSPIVHEQDDDSFLEILRLISFSGTRALIEDPELRKTTYPLLRGDFRAVANYGDSYRKRNPLLAPITGLAADNDLFAAPRAMKAWGPYTCSQYNLAQLRGDHYFVESDRETVVALVSQTLAATIDEPFAGTAPIGLEWSAPGLTTLGYPPESALISIVKNESRKTEEGPIQVYCFPGGGILADEFTVPESGDPDISYERLEWRPADDDGDLRCVEAIVDRALSFMKSRRPAPFMFYGHCLGALIAYELALRLREEGLPMPDLLVTAGVMGPHLYVAPNAHKLPADKLLELLRVIGYPFARRLGEDTEFQRRRLPVIRADLEAMAGYEYTQSRPLELPITAISLRHDLWSYPLRTDSWKLHTLNDCRVLEWEGDHYAPLRHPELIHEEVRFSSRRARRDPASVVDLVNEPSL